MIFPGPPGGGKTQPAVALAVQAGQSGISIYFTTMEFLSRKLEQDQDSARQGKGRGYNGQRIRYEERKSRKDLTIRKCLKTLKF